MINNSILNSRGKCIGFRCKQCSNIYGKGLGDVCNNCRKNNRDSKLLRLEINKMRKDLEKLMSVTNEEKATIWHITESLGNSLYNGA